MSNLGKIFAVLQFFLAIVLMVFAVTVSSYQKNWKEEADKFESSLKTAQSDLQAATSAHDTQLTDLQADLVSQTERADRAEAANSAQSRELTRLQQELERLNNSYQTQLALAEIKTDEAMSRKAEALTQRTENNRLHNRLQDKVTELTSTSDNLYDTKVSNEQLLTRNQQLLEENATLKKVLRLAGLESDAKVLMASIEPPPPVDGLVERAESNDQGIVEFVQVTLGSDDGLIRGHKLDLFRSGTQPGDKPAYLGQIELVDVTPERSVGRVIQKSKSGIIRKGDNVTSKLN